jgi:pimeloyl-ACP methyl ester carboxylesterase
MGNYRELTQGLQQQIADQETAYQLVDEACRTGFWLHDQPTDRVCLLFHGFTSGPYQFVPLAERLHRAGYNVLTPLLPGHGRAGTWSAENPPPLPDNPAEYLTFGQQWLTWASQMGDSVVVGGLSGGGTLAAWLAYEQAAAIDRTLLFAPYLGASLRVLDLFVKAVDTYFSWNNVKGFSYSGFEVKALRAILSLGDQVLARSRQESAAPFFMISSESDQAVNNLDHQALFDRGVASQHKCWYHRFGRVLDIPHTMMTTQEGNEYQDLLNALAQAYIESDLTWTEIKEIAYRMGQGRTFPEVMAELGWADRTGRDLPAFITVVDKREIALERQDGEQRGPQRQRPRDR